MLPFSMVTGRNHHLEIGREQDNFIPPID